MANTLIIQGKICFHVNEKEMYSSVFVFQVCCTDMHMSE